MEIDVFSLLFSLKTKREFKEKRLEEERERDEKREMKRGARSMLPAGFLPGEPEPERAFPQPPRAWSF